MHPRCEGGFEVGRRQARQQAAVERPRRRVKSLGGEMCGEQRPVLRAPLADRFERIAVAQHGEDQRAQQERQGVASSLPPPRVGDVHEGLNEGRGRRNAPLHIRQHGGD